MPSNYTEIDESNIKQFEPEILKCIEYIETAPQDDFSDRRKRINGFFMKWVTLSPDISIIIQPYLVELSKINTNLLLVYMCGWTKYSINNSYSNDSLKCNLAGLESLLNSYQKCKGVKKDDKIETLIKLKKENKLESWVEEQIKK